MFENTTQLRKEHIACVAKLRLATGGILAYRVVLAIVGIGFLVMGIIDLGTSDCIIDLALTAICLGFSIWGMPAVLRARSMKAVNFADIRSYTLNENNLVTRIAGKGVNEEAVLAYAHFDQLTVGNDALYLRLAQQKMYLVLDNDGFTKGTAQEAAAFLEGKGIKTIWSFAK